LELNAEGTFSPLLRRLGDWGVQEGQNLTDVPASALPERARRYRELECAARQQAERHLGSISEGYLTVARGWQSLAEAAEAAEAASLMHAAETVQISDDNRLQEAALRTPKPEP